MCNKKNMSLSQLTMIYAWLIISIFKRDTTIDRLDMFKTTFLSSFFELVHPKACQAFCNWNIFSFYMFLLRENFFSVIIPEKFRYYRTCHFPLLFWVPNTMCKIATSIKSISRSLFIMFNTSLSISSLLFSSTPWMSKQFRQEYCPCWSTLSSRTFDLSVEADTFSFNAFIILFFS